MCKDKKWHREDYIFACATSLIINFIICFLAYYGDLPEGLCLFFCGTGAFLIATTIIVTCFVMEEFEIKKKKTVPNRHKPSVKPTKNKPTQRKNIQKKQNQASKRRRKK